MRITNNYLLQNTYNNLIARVIFMEDHIPKRPDSSLLLGRQSSKWSYGDVVFHENYSI